MNKFQVKSKSTNNEWQDGDPLPWLSEVLEKLSNRDSLVKLSDRDALVVFDPDTDIEVQWRVKPKDRGWIKAIAGVIYSHAGNLDTKESRVVAEAVYDLMEERGIL